MVRAALMLSASSASALEPTGLLQATVGMQSHLSAGSNKASSLKKMEKEWRTAAEKKTQVSDEVLSAIVDSMLDVQQETSGIWDDIQQSVQTALDAVTAANTDMASQHSALISGTSSGEWGGVCNALSDHCACRSDENTACTDRDNECADNDLVLEHCTADNPLCGCDNEDNSAEYMKGCLERAKEWYENYHATASGKTIPTPSPVNPGRGYYIGGLGAFETRCDLGKEAQECVDGTPLCNNAKALCDAQQAEAQGQFCAFNTECTTWCSNYDTAYDLALATFESEMATLLTDDTSAMNNNIDVCKSAQKVICYINVIANKGRKHDDMSTDRGTVYDLDASHSSNFTQNSGEVAGSGFDFEFCEAFEPVCPMNMLPPTPPTKQDCADYYCSQTIALHGLPEASSWFDAYYKVGLTPCSCSANFYLSGQPESFGVTC